MSASSTQSPPDSKHPLGSYVPPLPVPGGGDSAANMIFVDVDDTVIEVYSVKKQGAGFGYQGTRGLNALLTTASTAGTVPVIVGQRLRKGAGSSARDATRLISDAVRTLARMSAQSAPVVVRAGSAYYSAAMAKAARDGGAEISVTVPMTSTVKEAISQIPKAAWKTIQYKQAIFDEATSTWISEAEVAEMPFTAFSSKKKELHVPGRLEVRRVPEKNNQKLAAGQDTIFDVYRHHGFFTTIDANVLDTVAADQIHRGHAVIEQVNAELKA